MKKINQYDVMFPNMWEFKNHKSNLQNLKDDAKKTFSIKNAKNIAKNLGVNSKNIVTIAGVGAHLVKNRYNRTKMKVIKKLTK